MRILDRNLMVVGTATALVYACQLWSYGSVFSPRWPEPGTAREVFAWGTVISLLTLYWAGYREVSRAPSDRFPKRELVFFAFLCAVIATFTFPFHSTDVFFYVASGWEQTPS